MRETEKCRSQTHALATSVSTNTDIRMLCKHLTLIN